MSHFKCHKMDINWGGSYMDKKQKKKLLTPSIKKLLNASSLL